MQYLVYRIAATLLTFSVGVAVVKVNFDQHAFTAIQVNRHPCDESQQIKASDTSANDQSAPPRPESLSPYDIAFFIGQHPQADPQDVWHQLGITNAFSGQSFHGYKDGFFSRCSNCKAEVFEHEMDGKVGTEVLLRIADDSQEACRYLVFKRPTGATTESGWQLLGHIDHDFGRYRMPQHYVVIGGGKSWLVIQGQVTSGSGVSLYCDRLFEVSGSEVREVLSYPSDGHQSGFAEEPSRDFSARIIDFKAENGVETVKVLFSVIYSVFDETAEWSKTQRAVYTRRSGSKRFLLDRHKSELSEKEIEAVYNIDSLNQEDFLMYNYGNLAKIASSRNKQGKEWLGRLLKRYGNTPQEQALNQILRAQL